MTEIRTSLRSPPRSPLYGPLEGKFGASYTVNIECPIDNAIPMSMRVNFTRTSGTLVAAITSQIPA